MVPLCVLVVCCLGRTFAKPARECNAANLKLKQKSTAHENGQTNKQKKQKRGIGGT
jgi:hypothetical protein